MEQWRRKYPCPIWHLDFLNSPDVVTMTHAQVGIYVLLLLQQWEATGCKLRDNPAYLEQITRCHTEEARDDLEFILDRLFVREDGFAWNCKMYREFEDKSRVHAEAQMSGSKGGSKAPLSNPQATLKRRSSVSVSSPVSVSSRREAHDVPIPDELVRVPGFTEKWLEWLKWRRTEKRNSVTETAARRSLVKLARMPERAVAAIDASIENDWQGLFPEKVRGSRRPAAVVGAVDGGEW